MLLVFFPDRGRPNKILFSPPFILSGARIPKEDELDTRLDESKMKSKEQVRLTMKSLRRGPYAPLKIGTLEPSSVGAPLVPESEKTFSLIKVSFCGFFPSDGMKPLDLLHFEQHV